MELFRTVVRRVGIGGELVEFFWHQRWWWLTPMIVLLLVFGALVIFAQLGAVAPFIYTLF